MTGPDDFICGIGAAGKGEVCFLRRCLARLLMEETGLASLSTWCLRTGLLFGGGNGSRDDALVSSVALRRGGGGCEKQLESSSTTSPDITVLAVYPSRRVSFGKARGLAACTRKRGNWRSNSQSLRPIRLARALPGPEALPPFIDVPNGRLSNDPRPDRPYRPRPAPDIPVPDGELPDTADPVP